MGGPEASASMQEASRVPVASLNECITCRLCGGYYTDATTIVECLHTFCRSCIVRYLERNRYCPVCDVQVHKTKPLLNIRPDKTLQDVVYKLVPKLYHNEMQRRKEFYISHPEVAPLCHELQCETTYQHILAPDETVCLALGYKGTDDTPRRYLSCPAAVTVGHLKKLLRAKYDLAGGHQIEVMFNKDCLSDRLSIMDVAYIYSWKRKGPIDLTYRIYEGAAKKPKLEVPDAPAADPTTGRPDGQPNNWKEVQLRISENGEMCITGIQDNGLLDVVENDSENFKGQAPVADARVETVAGRAADAAKKEMPGLKLIGRGPAARAEQTANAKAVGQGDPEGSPRKTPKSSKIKQAEAKGAAKTAQDDAKKETTCREHPQKTAEEFKLPKSSKEQEENKGQKQEEKKGQEEKKNEESSLKTREEKASVAAVAEKTEVKTSENVGDKKEKKEEKAVEENKASPVKNMSHHQPPPLPPPPVTSQPTSAPAATISIKPLPPIATLTSIPAASTTTVFSTTNTKCSTKITEEPAKRDDAPLNNNLEKGSKRKSDGGAESENAAKHPKPTILNHSIGLLNLSNNHPLKKHSKMNRNGDTVTRNEQKSIILHKNIHIPAPKYPAATSAPCYAPKTTYNPVVAVPRVDGSPRPTITLNASTSAPITPQNCANLNNKAKAAAPAPAPGYKTLREPPKTWNSQISRVQQQAAAAKGAGAGKQQPAEAKNARPAKFFKGRNNMPRYLGNPASGVKPMYQLHVSPEKEKPPDGGAPKAEKSEIRKHSIVKIDPKTLKPISEKAPETTSLSNMSGSLGGPPPTLGDLKINTSSVSIFNPLKLQSSSPKGDRRSPSSPHSPKVKATAASVALSAAGGPAPSPSPTKRQQPALNFTPPNPFVPDLSSPTLGRNPFLYPGVTTTGGGGGGPPGFPPPYDPRVMAAYSGLWYDGAGRPRAAFPRLLGMPHEVGDLAAVQETIRQALAAKIERLQRKAPVNASPVSPKHLLPSSSQSSPQQAPSSPLRKAKDTSKPEKSLKNAVEKLTQNKVKELVLLNTKNESKEKKGGDPSPSVKIKDSAQVDGKKTVHDTPKPCSDNAEAKENSRNRENTSSRTSEAGTNQKSNSVSSKVSIDSNKIAKPSTEPCKTNSTDTGKDGADVSKASRDISKTSTDISKTSTDISKTSTGISKSCPNISKPCTDISKSCTDISKSCADISKDCTDTSKACTDISKPSADISRPNVDIVKCSTETGKSSTTVGESSRPDPSASDNSKTVADKSGKISVEIGKASAEVKG